MKEVFQPSSSNINTVEYDSDEQKMVVTFKEGRSWEYTGVPVTVFQGLQHARSAGSYFWRNIRSVYSGSEV